MSKRVIIPTDFTVESLNVLKSVLEDCKCNNTKVNVVFVHGYYLNNESIASMFFFNKNRILDKVSCQEFEDALYILKNKYKNELGGICKEIYSGWNKSAFNTFINGLKADEVYVPKDYTFQFRNKNSFDLNKNFAKSQIQVKEVIWESAPKPYEKSILADIFIGSPSIGN